MQEQNRLKKKYSLSTKKEKRDGGCWIHKKKIRRERERVSQWEGKVGLTKKMEWQKRMMENHGIWQRGNRKTDTENVTIADDITRYILYNQQWRGTIP